MSPNLSSPIETVHYEAQPHEYGYFLIQFYTTYSIYTVYFNCIALNMCDASSHCAGFMTLLLLLLKLQKKIKVIKCCIGTVHI